MPSKSKFSLPVGKGSSMGALDPAKIMGVTGTAFELFDQYRARHPSSAEFPSAERAASRLGFETSSSRSMYQGRPQTANALYSLGFELAPWDEPTPRRFFHLHSRSFKSELEVIEAIGNVIKAAHAPIPVNVVTWDASLRLETINCEGQMECGTVKCDEPGNFKFLVFAGPGLIKWQGGGVGCTGNIRVGDDHVMFGDPQYSHP